MDIKNKSLFPHVFEKGIYPDPAFMALFGYKKPKKFTFDRLIGDWICLNEEIFKRIKDIRKIIGLKEFRILPDLPFIETYDFFYNEMDKSQPLNDGVLKIIQDYRLPLYWGVGVASAVLTNKLILLPSESGIQLHTGYTTPEGRRLAMSFYPSIVLTRQVSQKSLRVWIKENIHDIEESTHHLSPLQEPLKISHKKLEIGRIAYFWRKQHMRWKDMTNEFDIIAKRYDGTSHEFVFSPIASEFEKAHRSYTSALEKLTSKLGK